MNNENKLDFKKSLDTLYDVYNKKRLDQAATKSWWFKLNKYPLRTVRKSFDDWVESSSKLPTPHDIIVLCRSESAPFMQQLPKPKVNPEKQRRMMDAIKKKLGWVK
jgi:hypothetical protein